MKKEENNPTQREISRKKTNAEIRTAILRTLEVYPKTIHEICDTCKITRRTAIRHLSHLKMLDQITTLQRQDKQYWRILRRL